MRRSVRNQYRTRGPEEEAVADCLPGDFFTLGPDFAALGDCGGDECASSFFAGFLTFGGIVSMRLDGDQENGPNRFVLPKETIRPVTDCD